VDLLMVRNRRTGRFVYTERMQRRPGETPWEYVRRSVRREGQVRERFGGESVEVLVGWGTGSVEEFLETNPEYRPRTSGGPEGQGDRIER
jgi:hypothetical protein